MNTATLPQPIDLSERTALIRLTALWALNEAALGGLMHLFRSPFTGIFVGGAAVLLIALIGYLAGKPAVAIPRALIVVLVIKAMVSPHSPPPAYLAVSFQGLLGALLFRVIPSFRLAALLLGVLALLEAALQKLIVTTILFGMPLWESIDAFVDYVLQKFGLIASETTVQGSLWLIGLYLGVYGAAGLVIGWLAGRLPLEVRAAAERLTLPVLRADAHLPGEGGGAPVKKTFSQRPTLHWIGGTLLVLLALYLLAPQVRQALEPLWLVARVVGFIAIWYFLLAPLFMRLLRRFLRRKAADYSEEVEAALDLLPALRQLAGAAWTETRGLRGWRRWKELAVRVVTYALLWNRVTKPAAISNPAG